MSQAKVRSIDEAKEVIARSHEGVDEPIASRSMTYAQARAIRIARQWQQIPDEISDEDAFNRGLITPDMIILILSLFQELFSCLSNRPAAAMNRIRAYKNTTKELDRVADTIRFNWLIDRWMMRMDYPRDRGDVNELRRAFVFDAEDLDEDTLANVQTEILFLTI